MVKAFGWSFGRWQGGGYVILWDKMIIMFSQKKEQISFPIVKNKKEKKSDIILCYLCINSLLQCTNELPT